MTNQELFDRAAAHLLKQGKRAESEFGSCRYRGEGGTMCAIGCLIPDDHYSPKLEGLSAGEEMVQKAGGYGPRNSGLAKALQTLHDHQEPSDWREGLRKIARGFRLNQKVLRS